jgi:hypothetical protein
MKQSKVNKTISNTLKTTAFGAGVLFLAAAMPVSANENVTLDGKSIADLTAGWYQWQAANYPDFSFGDGEVDCSLGQNGPVWYLGGTGGGAAERTCDEAIKGHKHLMFPLVNVNFANDANLGENLTVEEKREILDKLFTETPDDILPFNSTVCNLQVEIDDQPAVYDLVPIVRTQTAPFYWYSINGDGDYFEDAETVADGFWAVLPPLARGEHTIHFTGGLCIIDDGKVDTENPWFPVDVTYHVTYK